MPEYLESLFVFSLKQQYFLYIINNLAHQKQTYLHIVNVSEQLDACFFRILIFQVERNYLTSRVIKIEAALSWEVSVAVNRQDVQHQYILTVINTTASTSNVRYQHLSFLGGTRLSMRAVSHSRTLSTVHFITSLTVFIL
jgi:hypothetical protein